MTTNCRLVDGQLTEPHHPFESGKDMSLIYKNECCRGQGDWGAEAIHGGP